MEVRLYGGPAHGHIQLLRDDCHRFEVLEPRIHTRVQLWSHERPSVCPGSGWQTTSYHLQKFAQRGETRAGADVCRELFVGLWECSEILNKDMCLIERDLSQLPWEWWREPNFLLEFDQWFEYSWCQATNTQPEVKEWYE